MNIVDAKDRLHEDSILNVVSYSQYKPTKETLRGFVDRCESDTNIFAFASEENCVVMGVIVLKHFGYGKIEIISIAVNPVSRNRGVATGLISFAAKTLACHKIEAETDCEAVDFYRKCGFKIESLGEKYPGTIRYLCTLNISDPFELGK